MSRALSASSKDSSTLTFNIYAAAIVFITMFGLITITNAVHVIKSRAWWLSILLLGGLGQLIGWSGRLWSSKNVYSLNAFLIQQVTLILSPCFYSAVLYGWLGTLTQTLGAEHSRIRPGFYMLFFCLADLLAIVVQAVGGAMAATALQRHEKSTTGTHIMVAGIALQLAAMLAFCVLGFDFLRRAIRSPTYHERKAQPESSCNDFFTACFGLRFGSLFGQSWSSCLYRMVELAEGWTGYLITHEPFFICLDAVPMVLCQAVFVIAFPPFCIPYHGGNATDDAEMSSRATTIVFDPETPQEKGSHKVAL
ncbi:BQ2448_3760 [Microbotryum intermedium]|uniref:BQ2448_3760 protein n=1 Tax=Microbotryum intermedium TaxID=269621 RepID=A0A238FII8_9BASI|nr:BQ2448_3760 [Microbotryum intermedium]